MTNYEYHFSIFDYLEKNWVCVTLNTCCLRHCWFSFPSLSLSFSYSFVLLFSYSPSAASNAFGASLFCINSTITVSPLLWMGRWFYLFYALHMVQFYSFLHTQHVWTTKHDVRRMNALHDVTMTYFCLVLAWLDGCLAGWNHKKYQHAGITDS